MSATKSRHHSASIIALAVSLCLALTIAAGPSANAQDQVPVPATGTNMPEYADSPGGWPYGFLWVKSTNELSQKSAGILVWTPPGARHIRSMLVIPNNTDSKEFGQHLALREVARKHEMAIVYLRRGNWETFQDTLNMVAEKTGIPEFTYAPWIVFGKSSAGSVPHNMMWKNPKRFIAGIDYHGAVPPYPPEIETRSTDETILWCNANGDTEWAGTWYLHVRPTFLNHRMKTRMLPNQIVARGVGHGDYVDGSGSRGWGKKFPGKVTCIDTWDYLSVFVDKALALRVPKDKYATEEPVELMQVDETKGYLVDRLAVEAVFGIPRLPLSETPDGFSAGDTNTPPVSGFAAFAPLKDFAVPEGVPVVKYESGKCPTEWIHTESLKSPMQADPMTELGDLAKLMPKVGDKITVEGQILTFTNIIPQYISPEGGIALKTGLRPPGRDSKTSIFAFTVIEFTEKTLVKVQAGYTAATRLQLVINGIPVRHEQILEMQPGRYPLLFVTVALWGRVNPYFINAADSDVAIAREMQSTYEKALAEQERMKAAGLLAPELQIRKYADVPEAERRKMLWLADKELADAWIKFHTIVKK